ncbi:threonylcarbamoyl-AMP synthase [Ancylomarina euxinus]|uniref:L-threonylcarbamoyladenylate synthase n=1 Tax=Ancylomarina euxinus TaxID=2283627 RepID=A0A425Y895_9BACT|nr:L-threonylcarbamoyladenylate synthase [Ancylomarina euxinus]MCZ4693606.1 L-threonylcarbamoyladenylate synthase [Ancylomarina euxinus]MUP13834.1 threonylcarbamoyl-AMP synthase [Ancylomarina euxinus]RRG24534.1 threonylcarbamoyl-AMP synthase [Ancylomarina euxinus]
MHNDIKKALEVLKNGGIILYPTDTIWGIGCDATNEEAVKRVYEIKKREDSKSMLVLMENPNRLNSYVDEVPEIALDLIDVTDKPMTIIYSNAKNLAKNLINSDGSIGIRITEEAFTQQLIQRFRKPIVSTSANISGDAPAQNFSEINQAIIDAVDYVVEYRQDDMTKAQASSIIKIGADWGVQVIRE